MLSQMGATLHWSSCRAPTFIAFAIIASISFVVVLSFSMESRSFVQLQRRHEQLLARQSNATSEDSYSMTGSQATIKSSPSEYSSAILESSSQAVHKPAIITSLDSHTISQSTSQLKSIENASSGPPFPQPPSTTSIPVAVLTTDSPTPPSSPTTTPDFKTASFSTITAGILFTSAVTSGIDPSTSPNQTAILATANSGFWKNKAAIAGTFVVVALIILGAAAGVTSFYYKKRNARLHTRLHDQLFDKYLKSERTRNSSPGPSIGAAPIDPREIHHDPTRVEEEQPREMSFYVSPTSLNSGESTKVVPRTLRSHIGRESYPTSIDSFYGASPSSGRQEAFGH